MSTLWKRAMADVGGSGAHRDLWKEYRNVIKEYEDKAAELQLDVQAEGKTLASAREQLANLKRGAWWAVASSSAAVLLAVPLGAAGLAQQQCTQHGRKCGRSCICMAKQSMP